MKTYFGSATFILIFINILHMKTCVYVTGCRQYVLYTVTVDLCVVNEYKARLLSTSWSNTTHIHSQVIFRHVSVATTAIVRVDMYTYINTYIPTYVSARVRARAHTHTHTDTHNGLQKRWPSDFHSAVGLPGLNVLAIDISLLSSLPE